MMGKRMVLVCPKCGKVSDGEGWYEYFTEYNIWNVKINNKELWAENEEMVDVINSDHEKTEHAECGFETEVWRAEDFSVILDGNKIVELGRFWEEDEKEREKLKEIAKREGWIWMSKKK